MPVFAVIYGIGVDMATVSRVQRTWERFGIRFARRFLHDDELVELQSLAVSGNGVVPERFLAKRFAVKEAAVKALGTGERGGVLFRDFALTHDSLGKPQLEVAGVAAERCAGAGVDGFHVSLSDEGDSVVAFVVFECSGTRSNQPMDCIGGL